MTWEQRMAAKAEARQKKRLADEMASYNCHLCYDSGWWHHGSDDPQVIGSWSDPCPNCDLGKALWIKPGVFRSS